MGVVASKQYPGEAYTPICNDCGVQLCWDISSLEYQDMKAFWDAWKCQHCNPGARGSKKEFRTNRQEAEGIVVGRSNGTSTTHGGQQDVF